MGSRILIMVVHVLVLLSTILLSFHISGAVVSGRSVIKEILASGRFLHNRDMEREVKKYRKMPAVTMGFFQRIELHFIQKSNINRYLPFVNIYSVIAAQALIFVLLFRPVYRRLYFVPSTVIICFIFSFVPLMLLDLMGRRNSEKVRRKLAYLVSVLNRWCAVKEDIFYAFEKACDSGLGEPLDTFIRETVIQVKRGVDPAGALEMLSIKVNNQQFRDFIVNIRQNIRHRGDIRKLLSNLEDQFYRIEEEYNRRKISTYRDRMVIYIVMVFVPLIAYSFLKINPDVENFYLTTLNGKFLLSLFCMLYAAGAFLTVKINSFRY